jgi:tyrosine-protein kinase Etk/Wzc
MTQGDHLVDNQTSLNESKFSLLDLLIVLARRKGFILRISFAAAIITTILVFLVPNQYVSEAVVMPPGQNSSAGSALLSQMGGSASALASLAGGGLGLKNPGDMYVSLFRTEAVEDAVIHKFGLMGRYKKKFLSDARKTLETKVSVKLGTKDSLIRVDAEDKDPRFAAELANGYVEEFRRLFASLAITEASQRRVFFEIQLKQAKDNLANAEIAMRNTEQSTGVLQIDSQAKALIESAAALRAQIVAKQVQIQGMLSFATDENPGIVLARQQLSALQAQLNALSGSGQAGDSDLVIVKGKIPEAGMAYIRRLRDVKYNETIYEAIAKQLEIAKLDEARQGVTIQVADPANPPDKKSSPHRTIIILASFAGTFLLVSAYILLQESLKQVTHDPQRRAQVDALWIAIRGKK